MDRRSECKDDRGASRGELGVDRTDRLVEEEEEEDALAASFSPGEDAINAAGNLCAEGLTNASRSNSSAKDDLRDEGAEVERDRMSSGVASDCEWEVEVF